MPRTAVIAFTHRQHLSALMKWSWMPSAMVILISSVAFAQDKPNVVIMLADNVGYGDIGAYGAGEVRGMPAPRIDSISAQGLRLTPYLVEPACARRRLRVD